MLADVIGYSGSICLVLGYLPQAYYTIRTRKTDGIALPTFLLMGFGSLFFTIQGILLGNTPLIICNAVTFICSVIIFGIKVRNDYRGSKQKGSREPENSVEADSEKATEEV